MASPVVIPIVVEPELSGGYLQTTWTHHASARSDTSLQASFDGYERAGLLIDRRRTFNLDFHHHFAWRTRQDIVWGAGYRHSALDTVGNLTVSMVPPTSHTNLFSAFIQDEVAVIPNRLSYTLGTKLEHNAYTGFGVMPSGRLLFKLNQKSVLWTSVSRGLRTPATFDVAMQANIGGFIAPDGTPVAYRLLGNPVPCNETLLAYEVGYRSAVSDRLTLDLAAFYNAYGDLVSIEPGEPFPEDPPPPLHLVAPMTVHNLLRGEAHGMEAFANWKITSRWSLTPSYAWERIHLSADSRSQDLSTIPEREGNTPHHWARLGSHVDMARAVSWDISATFADRLLATGVPSYTRLDSQLRWQAAERLSFSLVGQNLLHPHHTEFIDFWNAVYSSREKTSAYAKVTWVF